MTSLKIETPSRKKNKGRTFQCSGYPNCNMTFTRSEHLARHIRKHTGERPFECVHCSRKFSRLDNLRQHKQTVHAHEQGNILYNNNIIINDSENIHDSNDHDNNNNDNTNNEPAASTLSVPFQYRPKHRPSPLVLPPRSHNYNDPSAFTAPLPSTATSHYSLTTMSSHSRQYHQNQQLLPHSASLPLFPNRDTYTRNSHYRNMPQDHLSSPYNSSLSSSSIRSSSSSTPLNTSFEATTPSNPSFYNSEDKHTAYCDPRNENKRLKIESLLNAKKTLESDKGVERVQLPPVDTLGIL